MLKKVAPANVLCGDQVIINNHSGLVKYIDGPDSIGTYDIHIVDKAGKEQIEIVAEVVTISM